MLGLSSPEYLSVVSYAGGHDHVGLLDFRVRDLRAGLARGRIVSEAIDSISST